MESHSQKAREATKYHAEMIELIDTLVGERGSDIHISVGCRPTIRVAGALIPLTSKEFLTSEDTLGYLQVLLPPHRVEEFLQNWEIDFSYYSEEREVRFRGNAFFQRGTISIALRIIPKAIQSLVELNLPPILEQFAQRKQGFFLVVGPVGQGKSTTLASMIEYINMTRAEHIVTIEDPIEYVYEQKQCMIDQREVKIDTKDFQSGLHSVFREDINVILVGEMRNIDTIGTAVTAAETGHLVMSTLHTNDAPQTIDRIIDSFPGNQQAQIRMQLAGSLIGIFSQRLVPRIAGGLIPAYELLINTKGVANMIREGRTHEINTMIETGAENGMISMNTTLTDLVRNGQITVEVALQTAFDPRELERML